MEQAQGLAEALGIDVRTSCAALERHGGDADAAAAELLSGRGGIGSGGTAPAGSGPLEQLLEMGYEPAAAQGALAAANGHLEVALGYLLDAPGAAAPPPVGGVSAAAASARGPVPAADVGDCAICCEKLQPSDAAMRCAGHGGSHHYCHAACLAQWVQRCRTDDVQPSCPTCRGPLQLHRRNLRDFLQGPQIPQSTDRSTHGYRAPISQEDARVLQSMLEQADRDGRNECDDWHEIEFDKIVVGAILATGVVVAGVMLAKALSGGFSKDYHRNQRRR